MPQVNNGIVPLSNLEEVAGGTKVSASYGGLNVSGVEYVDPLTPVSHPVVLENCSYAAASWLILFNNHGRA